MLQNANSSSSSGSSGNNKSNKDEDGDTDGSYGNTGSSSDRGNSGNSDDSGSCNSGSGNGGSGSVGAFQPVKPRSMGNLSPVGLCVESTTKTDEAAMVVMSRRHHIDEMAVDSSTPTTTTTERRKKKPYKELTLEEKVQLIRLAEENAGMSQASIAERYSIAKSNVCRILQRKHEYLRAYEWAGFAGSRKRKLRGDPQHHHHHHHQQQQQQQQLRGNTRDFNNFRTLKMANMTNCTVSHNHSTNYMELTTSSSTTERTTNDNHLIVPQHATTIIHQRGNFIYTLFYNFSLHIFSINPKQMTSFRIPYFLLHFSFSLLFCI